MSVALYFARSARTVEGLRGRHEQHEDQREQKGDDQLWDCARQDEHQESDQEQLLPRLEKLPKKVGGLICWLHTQSSELVQWWSLSVVVWLTISYKKSEGLGERRGLLIDEGAACPQHQHHIEQRNAAGIEPDAQEGERLGALVQVAGVAGS